MPPQLGGREHDAVYTTRTLALPLAGQLQRPNPHLGGGLLAM